MYALYRRIATALVVASIPVATYAQGAAQSFKDLPSEHPAFAAAEYLKAKGILQGYEDGTFRPDVAVKRSEALKVIVAAIVPADQLAQYSSTVYADAPAGVWYIPFVEAARQKLGIIDGPPKTSVFNGANNVKKVEFLKMMLLANKINPADAFNDISLPLATDAANPNEWYYPYLRYALASSVTMVDGSGNLNPAKELTRAEVALLLYRFSMYQEGRRTQALLSEAESDIVNFLNMLQAKEYAQADYSSARALVVTRGALASKPNDPLVKGAVKTAEGFRLIYRAYDAGIKGQLDQVITLSGDAWRLADQAQTFSPSLASLASQMQTLAKSMADEARRLQSQQ